ncbi:LysM peptidoglycan-binding domain-containing M23 family metallopeptidase [Parvularcula sp. ZS-1/3]|uniref:LysM peptidoglycan-binding domain-containing M23 family metallopeptidase n=1 Tax=Parvularcula mediterranea TaxID=2732508 RepID=A0A7Y3RLS7_9PROT|nr:LysM peptidoglycan-binding domain-containing M23 family metallopeptidase [Parvularcula mediterranea]NNU16424.1 LysM peptidoglycan-binding domain-containing M23 family metallopeptidase [Parvularcula mediterranea]
MTTLKKRFLPVSSLALVTAACAAIILDAAHAQQVPVRYGTDPGYSSEAPQVLSYADRDAPEPTGEIEHVVEPRETVYALGRLYDVSPAAIIEKNGLRRPYGLEIGQVVLIPVKPEEDLTRIREVSTSRRDMPSARELAALESTRRIPVTTGDYIVRQGDTMYSISRRFGVSVAQLAAANSIRAPYTISLDQRLVIPGLQQAPQQLPRMARSEALEARAPVRRPVQEQLDRKMVEETMTPRSLPELGAGSPFAWPVRGPVLTDFGDALKTGGRSDGINIAAPIGAPVRASADGEVVYRGNELDGLGNLLLVKHDGGWVSAYAHADAILVRKGDYVRQGQVIAKVGRSGTVDRPQLHFQLRKNLQPQDPIIAMQGELDGATLTAASLRKR